MKLTAKQNFREQSIILPLVNKIQFDKDNFIEVEDSVALELIELTKGSIDLYNPELKSKEMAKKIEEMPEEEKANEVVVLKVKELIEAGDLTTLGFLSKHSGLDIQRLITFTDSMLKNALIGRANKIAMSKEVIEFVRGIVDAELNSENDQDETDYLLSSETNKEIILKSKEEAESGSVVEPILDLGNSALDLVDDSFVATTTGSNEDLGRKIESSDIEDLNAMAKEMGLNTEGMSVRKIKNSLLKAIGLPPKKGR